MSRPRRRYLGAVDPSPAPPRAIATPCIKVCIVDGTSGLCLGCYRTLPEITAWSRYDDARRAAILAELPEREVRAVAG